MKRLVVLFLVLTSMVFAKNTVSKEAYNTLQKANKLIEEKKYTNAKNLLLPITKNSENNMEKTYAFQSLANIYIALSKYKQAATYYEKILKLNTLEKADNDKMKFSLSQIYLSESMYKKSIKYSLELLNAQGIKKSQLHENLAIAYYYDNQFKKSIKYIRITIKNKKKKENWYRMLYSAQIESRDYNGAISTLKYMVRVYPKEEYWMQLISIYQTTKKYKKALATMELVYKKGAVSKEKNLMYLVSILTQNGVYNKAAKFIQDGLNKNIIKSSRKNFDILVSCYLNAKNYKELIPKLEKSVHGKSSKYRILLANIYFNQSQYKKTISVLKNYRFKKGSRFDGQKYIMMALSSYELDNENSSKEFLRKAASNSYEKKRAESIARDLGLTI